MPKEIFLADEKATKALGEIFADVVKKGDIITLNGDLGAGKTTFARALIRSLMNEKNLNIPSPSFALVQPYQKDNLNIIHVDFYRIKDENEVEEFALFDDEEAIIIAEWAQKAPEFAAKANWQIFFNLGNDNIGRNIKIIGETSRFKKGSLDEFKC